MLIAAVKVERCGTNIQCCLLYSGMISRVWVGNEWVELAKNVGLVGGRVTDDWQPGMLWRCLLAMTVILLLRIDHQHARLWHHKTATGHAKSGPPALTSGSKSVTGCHFVKFVSTF